MQLHKINSTGIKDQKTSTNLLSDIKITYYPTSINKEILRRTAPLNRKIDSCYLDKIA